MASLKFSDFLKKGEALMLRVASAGAVNDAAWFRGALSKGLSDNYYSSEAGFPSVSISTALSIMSKKKWKFANDKGRISQHILKPLISSTLDASSQLVIFGDKNKAQKALTRCKELIGVFGKKAETLTWLLSESQDNANTISLINAIWCELNQGQSLVKFK